MTLALENRKLKRRHVPLMLAGLFVVEGLWSMMMMRNRRISLGLSDTLSIMSFLLPLVAGLTAVQVVGVDKQERMGQWYASRGISNRSQFRRKLLFTDLIVVVFHLAVLGFVMLTAGPMGGERTEILSQLMGPLIVAIISGCIAVTAAQLALAQVFPKPATGLIVGMLGTMIGTSLPYMNLRPFSWILPWGLSTAANPAEPRTTSARAIPELQLVPNVGLVLAAALVMAAAWTLLAVAIVKKEDNR